MIPADLAAHARSLLTTNRYLTLGTVDAAGNPWTAPVYFTVTGIREFRWVSALDALHSRHLAEHPRVSLVVFDSTVEPYHGRALYAVGEARELAGDELDAALASYPRGDDSASAVSREDVTAPATYRLYGVSADDVWVLCPREPGSACPLHGRRDDHRVRVD